MAEEIQWTFQDAVERLLDSFGELAGSGRNERIATEAVLNAYRQFPAYHDWSYYRRSYTFTTTAAYSTGTVIYDHTGNGSGERVFVLTGGTWPTDGAYGYVKIDSVCWPVIKRISGTVLQASEESNPGSDVASTTYTWFRSEYPYPVRVRRNGSVLAPDDYSQLPYVGQDQARILQATYYGALSPTPEYHTVQSDDRYVNRLALVLIPAPEDAKTYTYADEVAGIPLSTKSLSTGTASVSAGSTTVTVSSAVLTSDHKDAIIRFSGSASAPTSMRGNTLGTNTYTQQRRLVSIDSTTTATMDSSITDAISAKGYTISSLLDMDQRSMLTAFWSLCEWEFSRRMKMAPDKIGLAYQMFQHDLQMAQIEDRRSKEIQSANMGNIPPAWPVVGDVDVA